jgi:hypothetical protein
MPLLIDTIWCILPSHGKAPDEHLFDCEAEGIIGKAIGQDGRTRR